MSCLYIFQSKINTKYFNSDISGINGEADYGAMSCLACRLLLHEYHGSMEGAEVFLQQRNVEAVTGEV